MDDIKLETGIEGLTIRFAKDTESGLILNFIKEIAEYEKMSDCVTATEQDIYDSIFKNKYANALIAEYDNKEVGFAIFFNSFSTFFGRPNFYLEDIFFKPEYRGKGFGKAMFSCLAQVASSQGCGRMEWVCLNWNRPSIKFYQGLGSIPQDEWTTWRLPKDKVKLLADKGKN